MHKTDKIDDGYLGSGIVFKKALKKYGKDNFSREILEFYDSYDELIELEKQYVTESVVIDRNTYNLKTGGQSSGILSEKSRNKISKTLKEKYKSGELVPRYESPYELTDKQKKMISKTLKVRYENQPHHSIGIDPWNKGKNGVQKAWNKGVEMTRIKCPYCDKLVDKANGKRWHFDNYKLNN